MTSQPHGANVKVYYDITSHIIKQTASSFTMKLVPISTLNVTFAEHLQETVLVLGDHATRICQPDNIPCYREQLVQNTITINFEMEIIEQKPYSPDIAVLDVGVFNQMKMVLELYAITVLMNLKQLSRQH